MTNDGTAPLVEAVLLAEFDIDKGSVCRVQYPKEVGDNNLLAELMLPEGVHNHFQDWTIFMLGDRTGGEAPAPIPAPADDALQKQWSAHAYRYDDGTGEAAGWTLVEREGGDGGDGESEQCVRLEKIEGGADASGAVSTAEFAIVVDLGGGEAFRVAYHDELQYTTLQPDFASMYTMDGVAVGLHFVGSEAESEFRAALDALGAASAVPPPLLWCLNHVSNRRDATVRRGAQVKAMAICSRHQFVHAWKPLLVLAVDRMYSLSTGLGEYSESREAQCAALYDAVNALSSAAVRRPSEVQVQATRLLLAQGALSRELTHLGHVSWPPGAAGRIPVRAPLDLLPDEFSDTSASDLVRRFRQGVMAAFHALLGRKRLVILGHSQHAETVCLAVLACPLLVCPPLTGGLARCYPYTTLNNLDFLSSAGFIAGTTNPIFESHPEWWDVLLDLDTGRVLLSSAVGGGRPSAAEPARLSEADEEVYEHVAAGVDARHSECWVRACFNEYAQQLTTEGLRGSAAAFTRTADDAPTAAMAMVYVEQLRAAEALTDKELQHLLTTLLSYVADEARCARLLAMLPASAPLGALAPLATALFHADNAVRSLAASTLRAIEAHRAAKPCVANLNPFLLLGLSQQAHRPVA